MTVFIPTRGNNPCQICQDTTGKCRETSHVHLCMNFADALQRIPGFRFIGRTKDNLWGKWIARDNQSHPNQANPRKQQSPHKPQTQHNKVTLSANERDRLYRQLLSQLTLHPTDREELIQRGLTDEYIKQWGVKSVDPWQPLSTPMPNTLPGVHQRGQSLNTPYAGYLCPIRDEEGRIVACQIRTRSPKDGIPKYYWLTSKTKKNPNGATPHLSSGELPLAVYQPSQIQSSALQASTSEQQAIALVEGTGAKPYLTSERLNSVTIGAAGGQFASSPQTLKTILADQASHLHSRTIEFYPDAGAVSNPHVLRQYRAAWTLLKALGYTVRIMWWNQLTKTSPDIDELEPLDCIKAITIEDFEAIAQQPQHILQQLSTLFRLEKGKYGKKKTRPKHQCQKREKNQAITYYKDGDRVKTWSKGVANGYQYILDSSPTGTGKSFDAGLLNPSSSDNIQRIVYLSDQHRNPTVETLSIHNGWTDLEARHAGLKTETSPNGTARLRRAYKTESPDIPANCSRTQTIHALHTKHIPGTETTTLICGTCPFKEQCLQEQGHGYGFLGQRRGALSAQKFRAHPDSLPTPIDYDYESSLILWDEPGQTFSIRNDIYVRLNDLEQAIAVLLRHGALFESLKPLLSALIPYLDGSTQTGRFGLSHTQTLDIFPTLDPINISDLEQALAPNLEFLNRESLNPINTIHHHIASGDHLTQNGHNSIQIDSDLASYAEKRVLKKWLPPLLQLLTGNWRGSLSIKHGVLKLSLLETRHRDIASKSKATIFLDATMSRTDLALKLGCHEADILEVRQHTTHTDNVHLLQVVDLGRMGMQRGKHQQQRAQTLIKHFQSLDETTKVIDFKKYDTDGSWWRDSRGVNDFKKTKTLILIGTPCRNLIDQGAEYGLLTGVHNLDSDEFKAYVNRTIQSDISQAIGRLRAHRRTHENLTVILISNIEIPFSTKRVIASEITLNASTKREQFIRASLAAFRDLKNQNQKITQTAVSKLTGYSQQYLSRFWKLLLILLEKENRISSENSLRRSHQKPFIHSAKKRHSLDIYSHKYRTAAVTSSLISWLICLSRQQWLFLYQTLGNFQSHQALELLLFQFKIPQDDLFLHQHS